MDLGSVGAFNGAELVDRGERDDGVAAREDGTDGSGEAYLDESSPMAGENGAVVFLEEPNAVPEVSCIPSSGRYSYSRRSRRRLYQRFQQSVLRRTTVR
jgi:hypothetical protein